jgi:hypothetical protein
MIAARFHIQILQGVTSSAAARRLTERERSRLRFQRADRLKIVAWDGSGLCRSGSGWSKGHSDGRRSARAASQLATLVDGMDWSRLHARDAARPTAT